MNVMQRRHFLGGSVAFFTMGATGSRASDTKTVESPFGPVSIPADPRRIVAIDPRTDVEPALVLGLRLVAGGYADDRPWIPFPDDAARVILPSSVEHIVNFHPDLIICCADFPDRDWWPFAQLRGVAPTLPTSFKSPWQADLRFLGQSLGRDGHAAAAIREYDALIARLKTRYADVLRTRRIASVQYSVRSASFYVHAPGASEWLGIKRSMLDDLGVRSVDPAILTGDGVTVSFENIFHVLAGIDAVIVGDVGGGGLADLDAEPLWHRVPAVAAGHVREIPGNTNYGSLYTARFVGAEIEALLRQLEGEGAGPATKGRPRRGPG